MKNIFTLLLLSTLFAACSKNCDSYTQVSKTERVYAREYFFPYEGKKYIQYLKNGTDTITFYNLGVEQSFNYMSDQNDACPQNIALEDLRQVFLDSIYNDFFSIRVFKNTGLFEDASITINNKQMAFGSTGDFSPPPPDREITILGKKYINYTVWKNQTDSVIFVATLNGVLKFTNNNNTFELIPN
jgi:hypothetical protein